jgi:hypothetical protein
MPVRSYTALPSLTSLYARVLSQSLPLVGRGEPSGEAPELRCDGIRLDSARLDAYRRVCGFDRGPGVPVTYPQVVTFPLQLELLTDPAFPFTALGAVHVANTIRLTGDVDPDIPLDVDMRGTDPRPHRRGRQLDVVTEVRQRDELVWTSEATVLQIQSTQQPSGATAPDPPTETSSGSDVPEEAPTGPQLWRLPSGLGRAYASVSGDRNPIHLYDVTALPLGFRHHIAHGMWTQARCLADLANRLPDTYDVHVAFRKPVPLPSSVRFGARDLGDHLDFGLSAPDGSSAYLLGRVVSTSP